MTPKVKDKVKDNITPISPSNGDNNSFNTFWNAYPKKVAKPQALKAFNKIKPDAQQFQQMLSGLENQKRSDQWNKDSGQYIPNPATWLNQRRWEDEIPETKSERSLPYLT